MNKHIIINQSFCKFGYEYKIMWGSTVPLSKKTSVHRNGDEISCRHYSTSTIVSS